MACCLHAEWCSLAEEETRRNQLMRDMAQLRLQTEVQQLEGSIQPSEGSLSPYLVPDADTLINHLGLIKQLASSARFIIVIPKAVIDTLDSSKKTQQGARDTIKYLEREFHRGNRYLRAQKENEVVKSVKRKKTKNEDKRIWSFYGILDCCRYFSRQSSEYDSSGMVTILTSYMIDETLPEVLKSVIQNTRSEGINVENVTVFHAKWKTQG
ncbi:protein SMG5-like [Anneissia japonica]|uniref:protein SMG5-like n=1 Tax=Anneissia japonica TaxID=1529436 RepID=UPI00142573D3|nr:protein SMG5-like [Anneissia japonica]